MKLEFLISSNCILVVRKSLFEDANNYKLYEYSIYYNDIHPNIVLIKQALLLSFIFER